MFRKVLGLLTILIKAPFARFNFYKLACCLWFINTIRHLESMKTPGIIEDFINRTLKCDLSFNKHELAHQMFRKSAGIVEKMKCLTLRETVFIKNQRVVPRGKVQNYRKGLVLLRILY